MQEINQILDTLGRIAPVLELITFIFFVISGIIWLFSDRGRLIMASVLIRLSKRFDKPAIGAHCAIFMKPRIEELNRENTEALLPIVKLEFTRVLPESIQVTAENQVIIVLKDSKNRAENLLRITESYVSKGVMPRGRRLVTDAVQQAVKVTIMHRLLSGVDESLRLWDERYYQPCISSDRTRAILEKTGYMDISGGYLTRIFLPQLELVARRLGISISPKVVDEANELLTMLYNISLKHHDDPDIYRKEFGELELVQPSFGVKVILVARSVVIAEHDIKPHVARVLEGFSNPEINEVYIIGFAKRNCYHALRIAGETYTDKRIAEAWCTFYWTRSRGEDNVPVVLVRYIKGHLPDEDRKRKVVMDFVKSTRKKMKHPPVTKQRLLEWLENNGEQYLGTKTPLTAQECGKVAKIMDYEHMTMEVLPYVFENEEIHLRHDEILDTYELEGLAPVDQLLYRIHAAMGLDDEAIIPKLDPKVFMGRKKKN